MEQTEILVRSSLDGTMQPNLFYRSESAEKRPLLIGLHSWSYDRFNQIKNMLPYAEKYDFNLLLPEFRGANSRKSPEPLKTCGSKFARQDIKDAIDYVLEHENIDRDNIFLMGYSGGGMMALLMAGMIPEYFKAIGAFVPITDLAKWHDQNEKYRPALLACTGGTREEMLERSPITYLDTIAKANLKIFHGKYDPTVPVSQSLEFFDAMMKKHPESRLFLDVFDGKHQVDMPSGMHWILTQYFGTKKIEVTG